MRRAHHFFSWTLPLHRHVGQPHRMNHRPGIPLVAGVPWCARRTLPHDRRYHVASVGVLRLWARGRYLFTPRRASARRLNRPNTNGWWRRVRRAHHVSSRALPPHRHFGQPPRMNHRPGIPLVIGVPWCARRTLPHDRRYHVASVGVLGPWARGRYLFTTRRASERRLNRPNTNGWWRRVRRAHHVLSATWPLHR